MGTKHKTSQEKFEYRMTKHSVEKEVYVILKPKKSWEAGLSFKKLKEEIELRRQRSFSEGRIYEAISLLNRFGKPYGIYVRSGYGHVEDENNKTKIEYRYFVPTNQFDISKEKTDLEHKKDIIDLKEDNLEHHEKITIPQEQKLLEIQR